MTNRDKLNSMSNSDFTDFLVNIRKDALFPFYNFEKWLASGTDVKLSVNGLKAFYLKNASLSERMALLNEGSPVSVKKVPCTIIGKDIFSNVPYYTIVINGYDGFLNVPLNLVEVRDND